MPYITDFKALLFDIDRTLTDSKGNVSTRAQTALETLNAQHVIIGVCTGRGYSAIKRHHISAFPLNAIHITNGGGDIVTTEGKLVWQQAIPLAVLTDLQKLLQSDGAEFFIDGNKHRLATAGALEEISNSDNDTSVQPLKSLADHSVSKVTVYQYSPQLKQALSANKKLTCKFLVNNLGTEYVDITAANVNKATAIEKWSKITTIPKDSIIGFGDSANDEEFLQAVGFSVAMGNADPAIKHSADRVIDHTDNDGLGIYLQNIINGRPL